MKTSFLLMLLFTLGINLTSCIIIKNGEVSIPELSDDINCKSTNQTITTKDEIINDKIEGIQVTSAINLTVSKSGISKAVIKAGDKDIDKVEIVNNNGLLAIGLKPNTCSSSKIDVQLSTRDNNLIKSFEGIGATTSIIEDNLISLNQLSINLSGTSKLGLTATPGTTIVKAVISGASQLSFETTKINDLIIDTSGASFAYIKATSINSGGLEASGASSISSSKINNTVIKASGASTIKLQRSNIKKEEITGASTLINE
jgi:hypothetical protein